jgi:hypothetical protein
VERPLLASYLPRYNAFQMRRHSVLPGIKFRFDVWYIEHRSLRLDFAFFFKRLPRSSHLGEACLPGNSQVADKTLLSCPTPTSSSLARPITPG